MDESRQPFRERKRKAPNLGYFFERMMSFDSSSSELSHMSLFYTPKLQHLDSVIRKPKFKTSVAQRFKQEDFSDKNDVAFLLNKTKKNIKGALCRVIKMNNNENNIEKNVEKLKIDDIDEPEETLKFLGRTTKKHNSSSRILTTLLLSKTKKKLIGDKILSSFNNSIVAPKSPKLFRTPKSTKKIGFNLNKKMKSILKIKSSFHKGSSGSIKNVPQIVQIPSPIGKTKKNFDAFSEVHNQHILVLNASPKLRSKILSPKHSPNHKGNKSFFNKESSHINNSSNNNSSLGNSSVAVLSQRKMIEHKGSADSFFLKKNTSFNAADTNYQIYKNYSMTRDAFPTQAKTDAHTNRINIIEDLQRKLVKENYTVYDSLSDDENLEEIIDKTHLLDPKGAFIKVWEILRNTFFIYLACIPPFFVAFPEREAPEIFKILDLFVDLLFIVDMILNFFLPYPLIFKVFTTLSNQLEYEYNKKKIVFRYLYTWFLFDLFVSVPYSSIKNFFFADLNPLFLLVKLLYSLKKFLKDKRHKKYEADISNFVDFRVKRLGQFFLYLYLFVHIISCVWSYIATLRYPNWISHQNLLDSSRAHIYFSAMYYNLYTIFSIGYGDIKTTNEVERIFNIFVQSVGILLYSYIVSSMTNLLKLSEKETTFRKKISILNEIKLVYNIDLNLYFKIRKYLYYDNKCNQEDKMSFLSCLPNNLKNEMISKMYKRILTYKFFKHTNFDFKNKVLMALKPISANHNEYLIQANTMVDELIIINRGVIGIERQYFDNIINIAKLFRGEHFGEVNMLLHKKSPFDLVVKSRIADLLCLQREVMIQLGNEYIDIFEKMKRKSLINYILFKKKLKKEMNEINRNIELSNAKSIQQKRTNKLQLSEKSKAENESENEENENEDNENNCYLIDPIKELEIEEEEDCILKDSGMVKNNKTIKSMVKKDTNDSYVKIIDNNNSSFKSSELRIEEKFSCDIDTNQLKNDNESSHGMRHSFHPSSSYHSHLNTLDVAKKLDKKARPKSSKSSKALIELSDDFDNHKYNQTMITKGKKLGKGISSDLIKRRFSNFNEIKSKNKIFKRSNKSLTSMSAIPSLSKRNSRAHPILSSKSLKTFSKGRLSTMKLIKDSKEINKNIIEGSMNINQPSRFYENIFDKWTINNQIRRLTKIMNLVCKK